jgi:hypothetical protein
MIANLLLYKWPCKPNLIRISRRAFVRLSVIEILIKTLVSTSDGDAIVVSVVPCLLVQAGERLPNL